MNIKYLDLTKITQSFEPELSHRIQSVVRSGWFLLGEETRVFEKSFANYCGVRHCIGTGNGLDALKIILMAYKQIYQWRDNDEVIVPAHTFIASAESIVQSGLRPVFCDISPDDYLLNAKNLELLITPNTRAVICVHLYGKLCDVDAIIDIARRHHLKVIEDAAQAHGAKNVSGQRAGSMGDAAAFSFYPAKNIGALGDAGAIVTNDEELALTARQIGNYGQSKKYYHLRQGVNSRMDEIQAAVLSLKLDRLDKDNRTRQQIAVHYFEGINNPHVMLPYKGVFTSDSVYHVFPVFCEQRDLLQCYLADAGIETIIHYPVLPNKQEAFKAYNQQHFPVAEKISVQELSIPLHPQLNNAEIQYIVNTINQFKC